jgi:hypothetical protein
MTGWKPTKYDPELHRQRLQRQQPPPQQPLPRTSWKRRHKFLTTLMAFVVHRPRELQR